MWYSMLSDPHAVLVLAGVILLSIGAGVVGSFTLLRKRALVGDAVAHSVLPGVCAAFMLTGTRDPLWLMGGAVVAGWVSLLVMDLIIRKTRIKADTATGLVLSVFFGLGVFMLTAIQQSGNASQSGLDTFLFGKAAAMMQKDVLVFAGTASLLILVVILFHKPFKLVAFDPEFARTIGVPVWLYEFILSTLTVLAVATGIQAVGVVLMAALLITPAAAARYWTDRLGVMLLLSAGFGALSGFLGTWLSYLWPSMPTGPWVIVFLSMFAVLSVLLAPEKGILARTILRKRNERTILRENLLKAIYHLGERSGGGVASFDRKAIMDVRGFGRGELERGLNMLNSEGLVSRQGDAWLLSPEGLRRSRRVVRLHRLWEMYLSSRLNMQADHVHPGAEAMEHLITPEIEALLSEELGHPTIDPHQSEIPHAD